MNLSNQDVLDFLPHRAPFLFVDTIEQIQFPKGLAEKRAHGDLSSRDLVGTEVHAQFEIKDDLEILKGHFPGNPILPGVIQVEMMAQVSAFVSVGLTEGRLGDLQVETLLLAIENAKFRKPIDIGMVLDIRSKMVKNRGTVASYEGVIHHGGEKLSEANFLAKLEVKRGKA